MGSSVDLDELSTTEQLPVTKTEKKEERPKTIMDVCGDKQILETTWVKIDLTCELRWGHNPTNHQCKYKQFLIQWPRVK